MQDYEKLGAFYLGRHYDLDARQHADTRVLYEARHLTTHGVCVGMTGSGKTGLCVALLEEAAIDGIPAIVIDPKGDLGNLMLGFPALRPEDFEPWLDAGEAQRRGLTLPQLAEETAARWRAGLAEHDQDGERIARLHATTEVAIYTPGSSAGRQLALMPSFAAPPPAVLEDGELLSERIQSVVSALLALVRIEADPVQSREHVLLSQLLAHAWGEGRGLDVAALIQGVQKPPFTTIGVLDVESVFPAKDRSALALALNGLIAAPGARMLTQGEPLDVQRLLWTADGKPRIAILSIAHLGDAQRMFFVTTLLNEVLAWVRAQKGTSSLRALLYMDEIFGYFPPTANPPSKQPMLTLLKQARAFGLGVLLATQNPVDLDYKGLSNCGTWLIGKLQTERDKLRVLDGLEGAAGRGFDRAALDRMLSALGSRVFLLNNVHAQGPVVFETRWTLSFLRGPVTRDEIVRLSQGRASATAPGSMPATPTVSAVPGGARGAAAPGSTPARARPVVPAEVGEVYLRATPGDGALVYRPALLGVAKTHHVQAKLGLDHWAEHTLLCALAPDDTAASWSEAERLATLEAEATPPPDAALEPAPAWVSNAARYTAEKKALIATLYEAHPLSLWWCEALSEASRPGETKAQAAARLQLAAREARDEQAAKLRAKYEPKLAALAEKHRKATEKVAKEQRQAQAQTVDAALSLGSTVLGALFGKKLVSGAQVGRARSTLKSASKTLSEREDVAAAEAQVAALAEQHAELSAELEAEVAALASVPLELEARPVPAKKSDIAVGRLVLAWVPWRVGADGVPQPAHAGRARTP